MPTDTKQLKAIVVQPDEGVSHTAFGDTTVVKLTGEQTGGAVSVSISTAPAGHGPPLHRHGHEDELFYVLEGRVGFFADEAWTEGGVGTTVFLPKGQAHTFRNVGEVTCKMLIVTLPSGFEVFFARCAEVFSASTPPDMAKILSIAAEHKIEFL